MAEGDITKRILYDLILMADGAIATADEFKSKLGEIQQQFTAMQQLNPTEKARIGAESFTVQVNVAKEAIKKLQQEGFSTQQILAGLKTLKFDSGAIKQASQDMGLLGDQTKKTSNILTRIFAAGIIGLVLGALRSLTQKIQEAAEAGAELSRSFLDIAVNARALKREGGELLPSEWINKAKELSKVFTQFSQQDINSGVSQLIRLGRQAGLTDEQIQGLIDSSFSLATVTGQDVAVAANSVATAVESGYARGLKELVGAIDETTIAQEAIKRGFAETEDEVDKHLRAFTVLQLLQEEAAKTGQDLGLIQESLSGQYVENKKALEKLKGELGTKLLPVQIRWQELLIKGVGILEKLYDFLLQVNIPLKAFTTSLREALTLDLKNLFSGNFESDVSFMELYRENVEKLREEFGLLEDSNASDAVDDVGRAAKDAAGNVEELSDELKDALIDIRELFIDLYQDISDEQQKFEEDSIDAADAYAFDLLQLNQKLQYDIGAVWRGYYDKLAEKNDDYRDKEIEEEKKYQEKLRKLRENFLLDLEDALRERDARQIIRLIRQYNLRKTQLERERKDRIDERKRDFENEKEDLARQRDIRLRELQIENEQRKALMAQKFAEEERVRGEEHKRRLAEEREQAKERLDELLRRLVDEGVITEEQSAALAQIYDSYFGTNGEIDGTLDEFIAALGETAVSASEQLIAMQNVAESVAQNVVYAVSYAVAAIQSLRKKIPSSSYNVEDIQSLEPKKVYTPTAGGRYAKGGTLFADTPTTVTFGEAGPEIAQFTPLNRSTSMSGFGGGGIPGRNDSLNLRVTLSPDLEARIIDSTLDQTARVIFDVERTQR